MASPATSAKVKASEERTQADMEAEIQRLRDDVAKLKDQLREAGQHGYSAARRAASDSVDHLKLRGEAAMEDIRTQAKDYEAQISEAVREKPISSLAIAAGVGYVLALLTRR